MKTVRYIILLFLVAFQLPVFAQSVDVDGLLDDVAACIKADAPVRMDYSYKVYDEDGELLQVDKGLLCVDNERYALLMDNMMVWCNGATQWSYMREIDEIYVTDASADEAQNLSPLYAVECYREGYEASLADKGTCWFVELHAADEDVDVQCVELLVSKSDKRLEAMFIYMPGQGKIEVLLDGYTPRCGVSADAFECPLDEFPGVEVVDMR